MLALEAWEVIVHKRCWPGRNHIQDKRQSREMRKWKKLKGNFGKLSASGSSSHLMGHYCNVTQEVGREIQLGNIERVI